MKTIIFSDVHGNLEALQALIRFIEGYPGAQVYSLGDIVGYGANPRECLSEVRRIAHVSLAGNHDHAAAGLTNIEFFNPYAKEAVIWTSNHLDEKEKQYLSTLPLIKRIPKKIFLVHSSPIRPEEWQYVMTSDDAKKNLMGFQEPLCFIGHSHSPMVIGTGPDGSLYREERVLFRLRAEYRYIINVGSIGQPRDGDWRACLVVYDDENQTLEFKRLEYDVDTAQEKIIQAGLPGFLAERLRYGR